MGRGDTSAYWYIFNWKTKKYHKTVLDENVYLGQTFYDKYEWQKLHFVKFICNKLIILRNWSFRIYHKVFDEQEYIA